VRVVKCFPVIVGLHGSNRVLFLPVATWWLFGVDHMPEGRIRSHGVVLCPAGPPPSLRSRTLPDAAAIPRVREGFDVRRFDFFGTGDAAAAFSAGSLSEWGANIVCAAGDLPDSSGAPRYNAEPRFGSGVMAPKAVGLPTRTTAERELSRPTAPDRSYAGCC